MRLEKWQRNVIFRAVQAGGLDPHECTFDDGDDGGRLIHRPSASYFDLRGDVTQYVATRVVGGDHPVALRFSWADVEQMIRIWAGDVKRDVETPDLWAEIQREGEILTGTPYIDVENTPFTLDEQAQIAEQLDQIKQTAQTRYALSDAQMRALAAKLDEIAAASGHVGRKDWMILVAGVMLNLIATDFLPRETVQTIVVTVFQALAHLFGGGGGLHLLPPM
jgi:hypothetical protein